jgi:hypothetical protein
MKPYVVTTGVIFGLIAAAHVWRFFEEGRGLLSQPWFDALTLTSAVLFLWACRLLWRASRP